MTIIYHDSKNNLYFDFETKFDSLDKFLESVDKFGIDEEVPEKIILSLSSKLLDDFLVLLEQDINFLKKRFFLPKVTNEVFYFNYLNYNDNVFYKAENSSHYIVQDSNSVLILLPKGLFNEHKKCIQV